MYVRYFSEGCLRQSTLVQLSLVLQEKRLTGYLIASCREIQLTKVQSTHEGQRRPWGLALVRKKAECHCGRSGPGSAAHLAEDISCSIDLPSTRCLDSPSKLPEQAEKEKIDLLLLSQDGKPLSSRLKRISHDVLPRHPGQGRGLRALPKTSLWNLCLLHNLLVWTQLLHSGIHHNTPKALFI